MALFLRGPTSEEIHALTSGQHLPPDAWMGMLRVCLPLIAQQFHEVFLKVFERTDAAPAAGEQPDSDEIVENAIDEVLGRTAQEAAPSEDHGPEGEATELSDGETEDRRPTATRPLTNGRIHGMDVRQLESENCDDGGQGDVSPPLRRCPLCRR
jgi:hypothetical protein